MVAPAGRDRRYGGGTEPIEMLLAKCIVQIATLAIDSNGRQGFGVAQQDMAHAGNPSVVRSGFDTPVGPFRLQITQNSWILERCITMRP